MRIESPREAERIGGVLIHAVQQAFELDSGPRGEDDRSPGVIQRFSYDRLHEIEKDMVIVVPMKNERLKLLQGVLYGIPHQCQVIVVSNSPRAPMDRYSIEVDALESFARYTGKSMIVAHQRDPELGAALAEAGYEELLDETGVVRNGKAEGMLLGTLLASLTGRKYIGFIDADNYFPGSVHEYVRLYSAGFAQARSHHAMVRINWHSKPKVVDNTLFFAKYGRTSTVTNRFMNRLVTFYTGFETEGIRTGNAGEHAMTIELALSLDYASGYAVEPYHIIDLLERYGGISAPRPQEMAGERVDVFQIQSRNPHLHEAKGEEHVEGMIQSALSVIYHSPVCPPTLRERIEKELTERGILSEGEEVPQPRYYRTFRRRDPNGLMPFLEKTEHAHLYVGSSFNPAAAAQAQDEAVARAKTRAPDGLPQPGSPEAGSTSAGEGGKAEKKAKKKARKARSRAKASTKKGSGGSSSGTGADA